MGKHIQEVTLDGKFVSREVATVKDITLLVKKDREIDIEVLQNFPIELLDEELSSYLWVEGSRVLINSFLTIDNRKMDIVEKIGNISIIGISERQNLILNFQEDSLIAEGTYRFTYNFLDMLFQMGKFSSYCLDNKFEHILVETVCKLCNQIPSKQFQYRLIKHQEDWLIRGVTSTRYQNYDNHLALYLTLYSLHKHAKQASQWFVFEKAYISDSEIVVMFDQINPINIIDIGRLYFGVILINNEIKERTFSLECRFRLEDIEGNSFGAIPPEGKETIFTIRHDSGLDSVNTKLFELHNLQSFKDRITDFIIDISKSPELSEDRIFSIFKKILSTRNKFSTDTRNSFKKLQEEQVISNSLHIIKVFHRLNELVTDVEEKIHLERIFYEVCLEIKDGKRRGSN
ncbi:hypothetical protein DZB84_16950 [Bacillus sp. HNG]|uniref:hypothetical protein n=1 Tax=Bacillus sp. HNG TaxID=2293325 RepID=UPI000E2FF35F|nr:hypothetical protein [Bacillus sp. HNG]RFB13647.1 hypothetical protein DZB84_16950 [Bacillus sp. HNG]